MPNEKTDEHFAEKAAALGLANAGAEQVYKEKLEKLAAELVIPPTADPAEMPEVFTDNTFNSHGYKTERYAHVAVQLLVDRAATCGIRAEVRCPVEKYGGNHSIWAWIDPDAWAVFKAKPEPSQKDWIKNCWRYGVNPRIFNSLLPNGLERELGLDFFGNEV